LFCVCECKYRTDF